MSELAKKQASSRAVGGFLALFVEKVIYDAFHAKSPFTLTRPIQDQGSLAYHRARQAQHRETMQRAKEKYEASKVKGVTRATYNRYARMAVGVKKGLGLAEAAKAAGFRWDRYDLLIERTQKLGLLDEGEAAFVLGQVSA